MLSAYFTMRIIDPAFSFSPPNHWVSPVNAGAPIYFRMSCVVGAVSAALYLWRGSATMAMWLFPSLCILVVPMAEVNAQRGLMWGDIWLYAAFVAVFSIGFAIAIVTFVLHKCGDMANRESWRISLRDIALVVSALCILSAYVWHYSYGVG